MRIEFDPTNRDEATAVRAVLDAMYPAVALADGSGVLDVLTQSIDRAFQDGEQQFMRATRTTDEIPIIEDHAGEGLSVVAEINDQIVKDFGPVPDLDANNEPHDPRIHSTPAKTNADGTWRAKRGVKAEEIAAVRAERELEAAGADPTDAERFDAEFNPSPLKQAHEELTARLEDVTAQEQTAPPAPNAPVGEQSAPPAPLAPTPPAPTPPVETFAGGVAPSFLDVMKAITAAQKDGKIDTAKVKELCAAVGAGESTMGLNGPDNGDKRGAFMALLVSETEGK